MHCVLLLALSFLALTAHGDEAKQNTLEIYIRKTVENFREKMKTGIPEIQMPVLDPLNVPIIDINIKEGVADVQLKITELICNDLSTFNIKNIKLDMATMTVTAAVFLPKATAKAAQYNLNGMILGFIPLYGNGQAMFGINDLEIGITTKINLGTGKLQLDTFAITISFGSIQVYLENILGGGDLGNVINTVINSFGKVIFDSQKSNIEWSLKHVIRNALNMELAKIDLGKIASYSSGVEALSETASANAEIDEFIKSIRPTLETSDSVSLPNVKHNFDQGGIIRLKGYAELFDGKVTGLSTVARVGDAVKVTNPITGVSGTAFSLSLVNLPVSYEGKLVISGFEVKPQLSGTVPFVKVFVNIITDPLTGAKTLNQYRIVGLSVPRLIVQNIQPLGIFASTLTALATPNVLNGVRTAVESNVRAAIVNGLSSGVITA